MTKLLACQKYSLEILLKSLMDFYQAQEGGDTKVILDDI